MSEQEQQPTIDPTSSASNPAAAPTPGTDATAPSPPGANRPQRGQQRDGGRRPGGGFSFKDKKPREKRENRGTPVPSLERDVRVELNLRDLDAEIENELKEALGGTLGTELLDDATRVGKTEASEAPPGYKRGTIISIHAPDVFVKIPGGRSEGVLPMEQFPDGPPTIGSFVDVHIEGYDRDNGLLILTRQGAAVAIENWDSVQEGMVVEARVTGVNKGGLSVEINGIRGFMPVGQIDRFRVENKDQYVNQRLLCMITEVNREDRNLVVSRRDLLERERKEKEDKLWAELAEGQTREGVVRSVQPFGAFVDLGGVDGLIHVSEMSWARVKDPASVLQPGQRVKVQVIRLDREKRKVGLGMKQLTESPWETIGDRFPIGGVVNGKVTKTMAFGAFVELEPGIEGLVHVSEVAVQRVNRVEDYVKTDQEVRVKILDIDVATQRISLSMKAVLPKDADAVEEDEDDEMYEAPVRTRNTPLRGGVGHDKFEVDAEKEK